MKIKTSTPFHWSPELMLSNFKILPFSLSITKSTRNPFFNHMIEALYSYNVPKVEPNHKPIKKLQRLNTFLCKQKKPIPETKTQKVAVSDLLKCKLSSGQQCEANKWVTATCCYLWSPPQTLSSFPCFSPETSYHQTCHQ